MIKNALLSLKKNIGKTILLFVIIVVITNLVIAGLSIQSATKKSMDQIRSSLGNDVTLSVDFRNMMKPKSSLYLYTVFRSKIKIPSGSKYSLTR